MSLTGTNSYTGDTSVAAGKLSLLTRGLADAADVSIMSGATLELKFSGTADAIDSLFLNGISQPVGTWGARLWSPIYKFSVVGNRLAANLHLRSFFSGGRLQQQWNRRLSRLCYLATQRWRSDDPQSRPE